MFPIFAKFADITIHTYGVMLALGFFLAILVAMRQARRTGLDPDLVLDLAFYFLIAGLLGSRLFYVVGTLGRLSEQPCRNGDVLAGRPCFLWRADLCLRGGGLVYKKAPPGFSEGRRPACPLDRHRPDHGPSRLLLGRVMLRRPRGGSVGLHLHQPQQPGASRHPPPSDPALRIGGDFSDFSRPDLHAPPGAFPGEAHLVLSALLFRGPLYHRIFPRRPPGISDPRLPFRVAGHRHSGLPNRGLYAP